MSTINDGGYAFPQTVAVGPAGDVYWPQEYGLGGMTLRDWLAGQALPTALGLIGLPDGEPDELWNSSIAKHSYAIADAMIAEREKGGKS